MIQKSIPENLELSILKNITSKIVRREKWQELVNSIKKHQLNPKTFFKKCNSV